jgi:quercetin dioxygenase-like cupin family protein
MVELNAGDLLWCPPGVKHWHGATPSAPMPHLALSGTVDNNNVACTRAATSLLSLFDRTT